MELLLEVLPAAHRRFDPDLFVEMPYASRFLLSSIALFLAAKSMLARC